MNLKLTVKLRQQLQQINHKCQINRQVLIDYQKKYRKFHPEKFLKSLYYYKKQWQKNKKKINEKRLKNKILIINHYTNGKNCCSCCGESVISMLTVDHINNDGNSHRKKIGNNTNLYKEIIYLKFPNSYQLLCWNCNMGKYLNNGTCPHQ